MHSVIVLGVLLVAFGDSFIYEEEQRKRLVFHEDVQTQCEYVNYDFNPILKNVEDSYSEVEAVATFSDLKSFAREAHDHVTTEIRQAVGNFCTVLDYGDKWFEQQYGKTVSAKNDKFDTLVAPIFQKYSLNTTNEKADYVLGKLRGIFLYTAYFLKTIRNQYALIGFDNEKFVVQNSQLNILNTTYSNFTCNPTNLRIRARACVFSVPNDKLYPLYTQREYTVKREYLQQNMKEIYDYSWSWKKIKETTQSYKLNFENSIDKRPKYMVKSNDTLMFVSDVNCTENEDLQYHNGFFDNKKDRWTTFIPGVVLCHRKYIAATTEFDPERDCKITSSKDAEWGHWRYENEYSKVTLNCTLNGGNTIFAESEHWILGDLQEHVKAKSALTKLTQLRIQKMTQWEHGQEMTELKAKNQSGSVGVFWYVILVVMILSLLANVVVIYKYSTKPCIERYSSCFRENAVKFVRLG